MRTSAVVKRQWTGGHRRAESDGASDEQTTVEPISIGEETVAEKANDLTVCNCIASAPGGSTP
jgi:hypothetical protein